MRPAVSQHRFYDYTCGTWWPDEPGHHLEVARRLLTLGQVHLLYAALGGVLESAGLVPAGPYEVAWTLWGPVPMPATMEGGP